MYPLRVENPIDPAAKFARTVAGAAFVVGIVSMGLTFAAGFWWPTGRISYPNPIPVGVGLVLAFAGAMMAAAEAGRGGSGKGAAAFGLTLLCFVLGCVVSIAVVLVAVV